MEEEEEEEEEEQEDRLQTLTLALFDLYWFRCLILSKHLPPPPTPPPSPSPPAPPSPPPPASLLQLRSVLRRSHSDDLSSSPTLKIQPPRLQTILSCKASAEIESFEIRAEREKGWRKGRERRRRKRVSESNGSSKSLSDLEFEELKGFMDLGFTFLDADSDPRLMEIVPGLQRLKAGGGGAAEDVIEASSCASSSADDVAVTRPYLSEAWDVAEEEEENGMRNLRIAVGGSEVDLKDQLRFWAHAVASTVR